MWWDEWDALGPTLERINMECQACRSLKADIRNLQQQLEQAAIAVRGYEQTIEQLRQDKAALQLNADMQITRDIGFDTRGLSS